MNEPIEEGCHRIKLVMNWFPGTLHSFLRRTGKTTAILETIREKYNGDAIYFCADVQSADNAKRMYRKLFPDGTLMTATLVDHVKGMSQHIFVDEWWLLERDVKRDLMHTGRVVARIGTEFIIL